MVKQLRKITIALIAMFILTIAGFIYMNYKLQALNEKTNSDSKEKLERIDSLIYQLDTIHLKLNQLVSDINPSKSFLNAIGFSESRNTYIAVNTHGYIGKYQFGIHALVGTGVCNNLSEARVFRDKFIGSPDSLKLNIWSKIDQEKAMLTLLSLHKKDLKSYIKKYKGKVFNDIFITESGILAAAHLGGPSNVKKYFDNRVNFKDGYGTTIEAYLKKFSGYKI